MSAVIRQTLFSHWRRHPVQLFALLAGFALATALWSGVQAINAEARNSYASAAGALGQGALDRLEGPDITLSDFAELRRAGWLVSPVLEGPLGDTELLLTGIDPLSAPLQANVAALFDGRVSLERFLSPPGLLLIAPEDAGMVAGLEMPFETLPDIPAGVVIADIHLAQSLLDTPGFSHLLIAPDQPGGLPPLSDVTRLTWVQGDDQSDLAQLTRSFHLNLTAFGLLSFAVGLFIVQAAIGLAFEARRATFRTLRALGVGLAQLLRHLAAELAVFAVFAGVLGLILGYLIAALLLPGVAGTLRGLYGADIPGSLRFDPLWALSGLAMTLAGAAAAGALALWRVGQMPLLAPARPRAWARASGRVMIWQAGLSMALLVLAAVLTVFGQSLITGFVVLGAMLLGAALLLPGLLSLSLSALSRYVRHPLGEWLLADARQQVPALSLALMALLLALSANIGVGTMVGSFRVTFLGWLDQRLASELYVTARSPAEAERLHNWLEPKTDAILPIWSVDLRVAGQPADVFGIIDHETYRQSWPLVAQADRPWDRLAAGEGVLINEQLARRAGLWPGEQIDLSVLGEMPIVGVYSDYGNPHAQAVVSDAMLRSAFPAEPVYRFGLRLDPNRAQALRTEAYRVFGLPETVIVDQSDIKAFSLRVFDQTFIVTGALNVLTLSVAAFAMLASMLTLSSLRLPQLAPVWALGQSAAWLGRAELARTALLAALTWVLSVPVGLALAWVLLNVVNVQAFGWQLPMQAFPLDWLWLGVWALVAAGLAAAWPILRLVTLPNAALLRNFANDR